MTLHEPRGVFLDEDRLGTATTKAGANIIMVRELRLMAKRTISADILDYQWVLEDAGDAYRVVPAAPQPT